MGPNGNAQPPNHIPCTGMHSYTVVRSHHSASARLKCQTASCL